MEEGIFIFLYFMLFVFSLEIISIMIKKFVNSAAIGFLRIWMRLCGSVFVELQTFLCFLIVDWLGFD